MVLLQKEPIPLRSTGYESTESRRTFRHVCQETYIIFITKMMSLDTTDQSVTYKVRINETEDIFQDGSTYSICKLEKTG